MPDYLAPGVYVEETSFRARSIEGVPTSTTGMVGQTRDGPICFPGGPSRCEPRLLSSFAEFERVYGGLQPFALQGGVQHPAYLAHAARAFFNNGGKRLYVSRVYKPIRVGEVEHWGVASLEIPNVAGGRAAFWRARWPGDDGALTVETQVGRGRSVGFTHRLQADEPLPRHSWGAQARGLGAGALVETWPPGTTAFPAPNAILDPARLFVVVVDGDGRQRFQGRSGAPVSLPDDTVILPVELRVTVRQGDPSAPRRVDVYENLAVSALQPRYIGSVLARDEPQSDSSVWLDWDDGGGFEPALLAMALQSPPSVRLTGGHDGAPLQAADLEGRTADPDHPATQATGLEALAEIDDIAIVAAPDSGAMADPVAAARALVAHAERCRYRIAVVDGPRNSSIKDIRAFRGQFDSKHAALYHPWVEVPDLLTPSAPGAPQPRLLLPPSGFVTGVYVRSDIERGVHKAPANEIVRGLTRLAANINKPDQDMLNAEGVNGLRFFAGRGHRVWGARTMSSDPEWKYVNVRRLFIYLEHSIEKASQWAVFEPNDERLWGSFRRSVEDFLSILWRDGALLGSKPEEAFFVRCDRSTMTQHDIDQGRLICLIGVAPVRPGEFVIFRVGQWTADATV